ncbi:MAG: hypothetical protein HOW73_36545 [Polyangiaceae bacterium]|nr:hypothetical protein [Polyangiaceae bacterium]
MRTFVYSALATIVGSTFLAGCSDDGDGTGGQFEGVRANYIDTYEEGTGTISKPEILDSATYSAEVESGGEFTSYPATVTDGVVEIPDVPEGAYYYQILGNEPQANGYQAFRSFIHSSERDLDLGVFRVSRPDVAPLTETFAINLGGTLTRPWQTFEQDAKGQVIQPYDDYVTVASVRAGMAGNAFAFYDSDASFKNGSPTLEGLSVDAETVLQSLIGSGGLVLADGSKGDEIVLIHQVQHGLDEKLGVPDGTEAWPAGNYYVAEAMANVAPVTMSDGEDVTLEGNFEDLPMESVDVDVRGSDFVSLITAAHAEGAVVASSAYFSVAWEPRANIVSANYYGEVLNVNADALSMPVDPVCYPDGEGMCDPAACAAGCNDAMSLVWPDDLQATFEYGNPFGGEGVYYAVARYSFTVRRTDVDRELSDTMPGSLTVSRPVGSSEPFVPVVGFVRDIRLNEQSTADEGVLEGVGTSPVVSFDPPELGTPTFYRVTIWTAEDILDEEGNPKIRKGRIARILTADTTVTIPPGVLTPGGIYLAQVEAVQNDEWTPGRPYAGSLTTGTAEIGTGYFTP